MHVQFQQKQQRIDYVVFILNNPNLISHERIPEEHNNYSR